MTGSSRKQSQRLQLACEPCKAGKLKCDRNLPICEQCHKRSKEASCKYTERGLRHNVAAKKAVSMKEKIERLEMFVSGLQNPHHHEDTSPPPGPRSPPQVTEQYFTPVQALVAEASTRMGNLKLSKSGTTQWVDAAHWESIIDDIVDVKAYFDFEASLESRDPGVSRTTSDNYIPSVNVIIGSQETFTMDQLLAHLPSKSEVDRFIATWFNVQDPNRVILHAPTFQKQYQAFWDDPDAVEPGWLALLVATTSVGAEISGQSLSCVNTLAQADHLRRLSEHALADSSKPKPYLIEALVHYILSLLFKHHDTTPYIWHLTGLTMRLCHQAGYHRDPSRNPKISPFDCEMRRRVWMVVCELDVSISNTLGMVSFRNPALCDTQPPSNYIDSDFSPKSCGTPRPWEEVTLVRNQVCFSEMMFLLGDCVLASHKVVPPTKEDVHEIDSRLNQTRAKLPRNLKMVSLDLSFLDSPNEIIDRLRIEFAYQKSVCILYRRFLGDPERAQEHLRCVEAAQTIVQHSIAMLEAAKPGGQLNTLRILLVRHVHDFALAAVLLCSELKRLSRIAQDQIAPGQSTVELRAQLLRACELFDQPGIPSHKAQVALDTTIRFLRRGPALSASRQPRQGDTSASLGSDASPANNQSTSPTDYPSIQLHSDTSPYSRQVDEFTEIGDPTLGAFPDMLFPTEDIHPGWYWPFSDEQPVASDAL